jgi:phosphoribosylformylglycinamidine cyclo-ligase
LIKGLAHITGGGLTDNIPRILPQGAGVEINKGSWPVLPVFTVMQQIGDVAEREMYRTFNMGVGMVIVTSPPDVDRITSHLQQEGAMVYQIGRVINGKGEVSIG